MARKTTTTPSNKKTDTQNAKPGKGKKPKGLLTDGEDRALSEEASKPMQATIGEVLAAKGTRPVNEVQVINFDRRLPCRITSAEITDRARQMKDLRLTIRNCEVLLVSEKEEWDKKKKSIESDIGKATTECNRLADEIGDEAEYRDVRCQRIFDYKLMQVREVRTDTCPPKQLQEPRAMTAREVEEGYTNADGARQALPVEQKPNEKSDDDGSGIVDDNYGSSNEKNQDLNTRPEDFA